MTADPHARIRCVKILLAVEQISLHAQRQGTGQRHYPPLPQRKIEEAPPMRPAGRCTMLNHFDPGFHQKLINRCGTKIESPGSTFKSYWLLPFSQISVISRVNVASFWPGRFRVNLTFLRLAKSPKPPAARIALLTVKGSSRGTF